MLPTGWRVMCWAAPWTSCQPQTRKQLALIAEHVRAVCSERQIEPRHYCFTRRTIRDYTGWSNTALKVHMRRLADMEYLLVLRGGRGQSYEYELLSDTRPDGRSFGAFAGIDGKVTTDEWSGLLACRSGVDQSSVRFG
ncbi:MAG: hypothetical protein GKR94_27380 [Gammaproteobacteria bacterium]|nr:hypothetical protein [Gammaproteobacteria bacterium]